MSSKSGSPARRRARRRATRGRGAAAPSAGRWIPAAVVVTAAALPIPNLLQGPARLSLIATGLAIAVVLVGAAAPLTVLRDRRAVTCVVFAVAGSLAVLTSPRPVLSFFGDILTTRGWLLYLLLLALALTTAAFGDRAARPLMYGIAIATVVMVLVMLAQWAGIAFEGMRTEALSGYPGTMGNPNFAAGWLGATAVASAWIALEPRHTTGLRVAGAVVLATGLIGISLTSAVQGPVVLTASVAVGLLGWSLHLPRKRRLTLQCAVALMITVWLVGIGAGLADTGPLAGAMNDPGVQQRQDYWATAIAMGSENPVTGVGFERYGLNFRAYRSVEAAGRVGVDSIADAAHNLPLQMFATGGVVLLVSYLALVIAVSAAGIVALRRATSDKDRRLTATLFAVWAGYHVQSLLSIDDPALAVLGWVSGGVLVGLWRSSDEVAAGAAKTRSVRVMGLPAVSWSVAAAILMLGLTPLVIEYASGARLGGAPENVLARIDRSAGLAPWEPRYPKQDGVLSLREGLGERARRAFTEANERAGGEFAATLSLARTELALGNHEAAMTAYEAALDLEPAHPAVAAEVARVTAEQGNVTRASDIVDSALADHPDDPDLLEIQATLSADS